MTRIRVIPRLDIKGPNVVKGIHCEGLRVMGNPEKMAKKYYNQGADEILYLDIVASLYQRNFDFEQLKQVAKNIFVPITAGGGIRNMDDMSSVLRAGADKVAINTYAVHNPEFIAQAVSKYGSQCVVLSVEVKAIDKQNWEVYVDGGREKTGKNAKEWIMQAIKLGVGEIIITSIDREGTRRGFDQELVSEIVSLSPVPVIASGGAGGMDTVVELLESSKTHAVSAASVFHYNEYTVKKLKEFLKKKGIDVRL